jgi:hypothetical protein
MGVMAVPAVAVTSPKAVLENGSDAKNGECSNEESEHLVAPL